MSELKNQVAGLSIDIAEKVVRAKLSDDSEQGKLVEELVKETKEANKKVNSNSDPNEKKAHFFERKILKKLKIGNFFLKGGKNCTWNLM